MTGGLEPWDCERLPIRHKRACQSRAGTGWVPRRMIMCFLIRIDSRFEIPVDEDGCSDDAEGWETPASFRGCGSRCNGRLPVDQALIDALG